MEQIEQIYINRIREFGPSLLVRTSEKAKAERRK